MVNLINSIIHYYFFGSAKKSEPLVQQDSVPAEIICVASLKLGNDCFAHFDLRTINHWNCKYFVWEN